VTGSPETILCAAEKVKVLDGRRKTLPPGEERVASGKRSPVGRRMVGPRQKYGEETAQEGKESGHLFVPSGSGGKEGGEKMIS